MNVNITSESIIITISSDITFNELNLFVQNIQKGFPDKEIIISKGLDIKLIDSPISPTTYPFQPYIVQPDIPYNPYPIWYNKDLTCNTNNNDYPKAALLVPQTDFCESPKACKCDKDGIIYDNCRYKRNVIPYPEPD